MRQRRLAIALGLALGVALVASATVILRQSRRLADSERQRAADRESLRQLREALHQRESEKTPVETGNQAEVSVCQAALARRDAVIARLNGSLSDAKTTIAGLETQLSNSKDEDEKALANATELHRKAQVDWQSRLDALKQELDSAEADAQASRQRAAALEADNKKLRNENREGSTRAAESARVVASLEDLSRRRDACLTSITRRYREITSQFRAMTGMLDSSRDQNSSAFSGAALTRIQDAVSLADDDLQQLNELNAQVRQLEKKLPKK